MKVRAKRATVEYRERAHLHTHSLLKPFIQHLYVCSTYLNSGRYHCSYINVSLKAIEQFVLEKIREALKPVLASAGARRRVQAQLEKLYGRPRETAETIQKRLEELEERIRILERLDEKERKMLGIEINYHEAKEELAKLSRIAEAGPAPRIDIEATTNEIMACLSNLENFENLPAKTQKAFFEKFVERIDLEFEKVKKLKKVTTALKRGVLRLVFPLPLSPCLGLGGSGARFGTDRARDLEWEEVNLSLTNAASE